MRSALLDKGANGLEIEALAEKCGSYLEAVITWLEENSIEINKYHKHIPNAVIDKLKQECIEANMIRPSARKTMTQGTLDFLM